MNNFLRRMEALLGDELEDFLKFYNAPEEYYRALRVNTLKCSSDKLRELMSFPLEKVPFCNSGFYIPRGTPSLGSHPLHHAGAFYIQEPSAMSAVTMLNVERGDFVLDLCAAPGGKSTQIAALLDSTGLLWSNETVKSRANVLLSNIERMGVRNAVVSSCPPEKLCGELEGVFDKVLVDAPCSGEGMFRKEPNAAKEWSENHVKSCAERQLKILNSAKKALKSGGALVYSTCTFSEEENEGVIEKFLKANPDFTLDDAGVDFGRASLPNNGGCARRIYPMDGGEGHFAARLKKAGVKPEPRETACPIEPNKLPDGKILEFYKEIFPSMPFGESIRCSGDTISVLPKCLGDLNFGGLNVLRAGVRLGTVKNNRIEPHHSAFAAARPSDCALYLDFDVGSEELRAFIHGEELPVLSSLKGWVCVGVRGVSLGFGKATGGRLKNKYPKGLRILK